MKVKIKIFQLIKWEDRKKFFHSVDWKEDGEYDLIHCKLDQKISKREMLIGIFASIFNKTYGKNYSQDTFYFQTQVGFPIWVKRPHEFKIGDLVEIQVTLRSVLMEEPN